MIGLQSAEGEPGCRRDVRRQYRRGFAGRHAATCHADIDFNQGVEYDTDFTCGARGRVDLFGRVEAQADAGIAREGRETAQLVRADHLVAHQHIAHTATHQRFGLTYFLAALADGAGGDLLHGDYRALVGLGMRAQPHARGAGEVGKLRQVGLESVQVDNQRGGVDLVERRADGCRWIVHLQALASWTVSR